MGLVMFGLSIFRGFTVRCFKIPFQGLNDLNLGKQKDSKGHLEEAGP